jgi:general transcriptional corepressor TUP1
MSMYNSHRGMGPAPGTARLNELLDGIRAEFETQARASGEYEHSSELSGCKEKHYIA